MKINSAREWHCAPDYYWETGDHPWQDFCLWFVRKGRGTVENGGKKYPAEAGGCFILRGTDRYTAYNRSDDPLVVMAVHYDLLEGAGQVIVPSAENAPPLLRRMADGFFFSSLLHRVIEGCERAPAEALTWFQAALAETSATDRRPTAPLDDRTRALDALCEAIRTEPHRIYDVERLARKLSCTPDHFTRLFKKTKGVTPRDFIVHARIEAAKTLLKSSSHPVGRVAELLGYSDVYFFSRQFKKKTGHSPKAYRKS